MPERPTIGVEEEFLTVDATTHELRPLSHRVLWASRQTMGGIAQPELSLAQIEIATSIHDTLPDLLDELRVLRSALDSAAATRGAAILSTGTHPNGEWMHQAITPSPRFLEMEGDYQQLAREQLICGCHVHVGIDDPDDVVRAMDAIRPVVPTLLALAANSPYWMGVDTGYASYRTQLFDRWPTAGPPPVCGSWAGYESTVDQLIRFGVIADPSYIYWHLRPSNRYPTLELRVADACLSTEDTVMIAALFRSLVRTALRDLALERRSPSDHSAEVLRGATWRASRYGLSGTLLDLVVGDIASAEVVVRRLLARQRDDLEAHGEWESVSASIETTLRLGNGASRQRRALRANGSLSDVAQMIADSTRGTTVSRPAGRGRTDRAHPLRSAMSPPPDPRVVH